MSEKPTVWIMGAGRFGRMAAERLQKRYRILVVDNDANALNFFIDSGFETEHRDAVSYLLENLSPKADVKWVIPALPIHLIWHWCKRVLSGQVIMETAIPDDLPALVPNPVKGEESHLYTSHAEFLCPDDCPEPAENCTVTGHPRPWEMYALLADIRYMDYNSIVIQSRQIAPGVGGYPPQDMFLTLDKIKKASGNLLISTACKCHGVITGASVKP
jgi:hypothetical protein